MSTQLAPTFEDETLGELQVTWDDIVQMSALFEEQHADDDQYYQIPDSNKCITYDMWLQMLDEFERASDKSKVVYLKDDELSDYYEEWAIAYPSSVENSVIMDNKLSDVYTAYMNYPLTPEETDDSIALERCDDGDCDSLPDSLPDCLPDCLTDLISTNADGGHDDVPHERPSREYVPYNPLKYVLTSEDINEYNLILERQRKRGMYTEEEASRLRINGDTIVDSEQEEFDRLFKENAEFSEAHTLSDDDIARYERALERALSYNSIL